MTFSKILTDQRDKKREGEVSSSHCNGVPMGNARSRMWMGILVFGLLFLLTCSDNKDSGNGDNGDNGNGNGNGDTTHKYSCTNGTAASGEAASENTEKCDSCEDGYKLTDAESCAAIKYTCTNGTVKAGAPTTGNADVEFCTACNSSYGIAGNQCLMITTINGTSGNDAALNGTPGPNIINGLAGNDVLNGLAGNDELNGGAGNDTLNGGAGADVLDGGADSNIASYVDASVGVVVYLKASDGSNEGEAAGDTYSNIENLTGSGHDDTLQGDDDSNVIRGGGGNDVLNGGAGLDFIYGQTGNDTIQGGGGDDTLNGDAGNDTISGGGGVDTIYGGAGNDTLSGGAMIDFIFGGPGNDNIQGGDGNDNIYSQAGDDTMTGDGGNDTFELEITHSEKDIVTDFAKGDKIRVDTTAGTESTLVALKAAADIDWVNTANHDTGTATNDASIYDTVISDTKGTTDTADDVVIMVLEDYTTTLVIGDFFVY